MPAVISALLESPLAARYRFDAIATYRDARPLARLVRFGLALVALVRWCAGSGPRIVHVHMAARGSMYRKGLVVAVAKAMGRPVVLQIHAGPGDLSEFFGRLDPLRRRLLNLTLSLADRVLSVSASGAETLRELLPEVDVEVVPNAPPQLAAGLDGNGSRSGGEAPSALFLGGFADPAKGGAVLLEALPGLLERAPQLRVELAGPGEGPASLPERARWLGLLAVPEKNRALAEADLFVMPSLSEGMPIALLEAMVNGLPIVATRVGAVPEVLTDGEDAVLVEPDDAEALGRAVAVLAADAERCQALGAAARERARRLADEDVYQRLDRIYLSLLR